MTKLLIGIASPRDIPEVIESFKDCQYDQLWCKYMYAKQAYHTIQKFYGMVLWALVVAGAHTYNPCIHCQSRRSCK